MTQNFANDFDRVNEQKLKSAKQNIQTEDKMPDLQAINQIFKVSPLSVAKVKQNSDLHLNLNQISIKSPSHIQSVSRELEMNLKPSSSPRLSKNSRKWNAFNNFFKKEIHMHQKQMKKNPQIKLIQNTQKLINNRHSSFDRYILHSTKRLKIISENIHNQQSQKVKSFGQTQTGPNSYFISLPEQNEQPDERITEKMDEKRRKSSQEGKKIFKGITSRKNHNLGRFSLEFEKQKSPGRQNEEEFVQHKKINLYQSLIYGQNLKKANLASSVTESLGGDYARIDRSKTSRPDDGYIKRKRKTQSGERFSLTENMISGFPTKKVENNEPQVLTIHIKRPESKFHSSSINRQEKNISHNHPRPIPISNINIFKRPNTTLFNGRRDSEIEPW